VAKSSAMHYYLFPSSAWFPATTHHLGGGGIGGTGIGRRPAMRLLALGAATILGFGRVSAQPAGRAAAALKRQPTIVIDPGHGGVDPGAVGRSGVYEKDVVLSTARDFAHQLAATRRYRVILTRSVDEFLPLRERVARARAWRADLFLSIHADALPAAEMRGLSVFTLSGKASDREAAALAARENRADRIGGIDLSQQPREVSDILVDLARRQTSNASIALARNVIREFDREIVLLDHAQRSADFVVLTAPDIPSVLVELGCLSNPQEERLLQSPTYQQKLARGLVRSVVAYFARATGHQLTTADRDRRASAAREGGSDEIANSKRR
jgi:N-acetylmuramoyl-L-alanine amidase